MTVIRTAILLVATLSASVLFGFYLTMPASIMPSLDQADPYAAINANQHIGRATQASAFFVALLGTPVALLAALVMFWEDFRARLWIFAALLRWVGMMIVTLTGNVPFNGILDGLTVSPDEANLAGLWASYSIDWQCWNGVPVATSRMTVAALMGRLMSAKAGDCRTTPCPRQSLRIFWLRRGGRTIRSICYIEHRCRQQLRRGIL